jgi:hypothetical protein
VGAAGAASLYGIEDAGAGIVITCPDIIDG